DGTGFRLDFADGTEFLIDRAGGSVSAAGASRSPGELAWYLLGPILAFVLSLRRVTCLHASAVAIRGRAVAFVGPSGAGKSTLAAALAQRGFSVLSDDLLALSAQGDTLLAHPGVPWLRLRRTSVDTLVAAGGTPSQLTPTLDHRYVDLE